MGCLYRLGKSGWCRHSGGHYRRTVLDSNPDADTDSYTNAISDSHTDTNSYSAAETSQASETPPAFWARSRW